MQRRTFLSTTLATGLGISAGMASRTALAEQAPPEAGLFCGSPVVSGPAADALCILQPVRGPASGFLEVAVGDGPFERIDAEMAGLLPLEQYALKFRLPPLPAAQTIRYRVTARTIDFQTAYKIVQGEPQVSDICTFRTLDPAAPTTHFVIWNDTHENEETLRALHAATAAIGPDFLLWNGDQVNAISDIGRMTGQYLAPAGLAIAARWPLAYVRGNHDARGVAARHLPEFTGTPGDRFYYAFRSGPLGALVMDTGEDKPDDAPPFAGLACFDARRRQQREWLAQAIAQPWFRSAPLRVLFCHLPLWWTDESETRGYWAASRPSRDAWLPLLQEAGVQAVISAHTHQVAWLPPGADRPIGQFTGGGPQRENAALVDITVDAKQLALVARGLDGSVMLEVKVPA